MFGVVATGRETREMLEVARGACVLFATLADCYWETADWRAGASNVRKPNHRSSPSSSSRQRSSAVEWSVRESRGPSRVCCRLRNSWPAAVLFTLCRV